MTYYDDIVTGTSGVTHYYKFEGNLNDSVGSSNFTAATGYSAAAGGREGSGLIADANTKTGPYLASSLSTLFGSTYSVEFWFKYASNASAQELLRVADDVALEMGSDGKILYYYKGTSGTTTGAFNDNAWHHLVITRDGSRNVIVYIDGTSVITFTAPTGSPTSGNVYFAGSQYTGQAARSGAMDSIAIYSTALSSGTVTTHKNAMGGGAYTAQVLTASATAPGGTGTGNVQTLAVTDDAQVMSASPDTNFGSSTTASSSVGLYIKAAAQVGSESEISKTLNVYQTNLNEETVGVYRILADWNEGTITYNNKPAIEFVRNHLVAYDTGWEAINVTGADIGYGVALVGSSHTWNTSENAANKPYMTLVTQPQSNASYTAQAMTASATLPNASVATSANAQYGAQAMAGSAVVVNPAVAVISIIDIDAEPMEAQAELTVHNGFAEPLNVSAEVITASATTVDASVSTQRGPTIAATPFTATAAWIEPDEINGAPIVASESEDKYFQRVMSKVPKTWFRLNDAGSTAVDRMGGLGGIYHGVQTGQHNGPENRHSVHFDGTASIEQTEVFGENLDEAVSYRDRVESTLEFSFRTTKANAFLMASADSMANTRTFAQSAEAAKELYLRNGKISLRTHFFPNSLGMQWQPYEFTGFKNLADNQWHSVVVKGWVGRFAEIGVEIWVDGKMEVRRVDASGARPILGFPDWIGSRPEFIDVPSIPQFSLGVLPSTLNFVGDMSEVVFYSFLVSDHEIAQHYYDFMGWNPIRPETFEAFAFTPADTKGRGNQKRALYLWWEPSLGGGGSGMFDPLPNARGNWGTYDYEGWKVFSKGITRQNNAAQGPFRDPVTDRQTIINLETDIDVDEYDMIMFHDWPDESGEIEYYDSLYPGDRERLIRQLREANDRGVGLFITHPRLAVDLGIVDRVELTGTLRETANVGGQGNASGLYDYGSAVKFPWNIVSSSGIEGQSAGSLYSGVPQNMDPAFLANKAFYYGDTHKNDRFRVRALIEGLTDIPAYMYEEAIYQKDYDVYGWQIAAYKYLHRMEGLHIGDEYLFHGTDFGLDQTGYSSFYSWFMHNYRWDGAYATPPGHVKAGTIVTTFGSTHWLGTQEVENPYRDYATTIVLEPGDSLNGRAVGGKIYVNFTEQPNDLVQGVPVQVLPQGDEPWPYAPETPAQRAWEYSSTRVTLHSTQASDSSSAIITLPDGSSTTVPLGSGASTMGMTRSISLFPVIGMPSFDMNRRGLEWLKDRVEHSDDDSVQRVEAITASAAMPQPAVVAEKDADVSSSAMAALAVMPKVAEDESGDVDIRTLPLSAHAEFTGFSKVISAAPMTATATLVENFDMVHATGEQVVLTLHGVDATLYLKEDA